MEQVVHIASPAALVLLGGLFLFVGYRLLRIVAVVSLGALGAMWGHEVAVKLHATQPLWGALVGGVVLGLLAIPLLRAALVAAMGLMVARLAWFVWPAAGWSEPHRLIGALGGFVLGVILGVVLFRFVLITISSVMGASLMTGGAVWFILRRPPSPVDVLGVDTITKVSVVAAAVVLVIVGILVQSRGSRRWRARQAAAAA